MKNITRLTLLLFLIISSSSFGQSLQLKKGDDIFARNGYIDAREIYLKVVENGYKSKDIYQRLADSYYFNGNLVNSSKWYELLVQSYSEGLSPEYYFRYAQSLKGLEKYEEADKIMDRFFSKKKSDKRAKLFQNRRDYLRFIELQSGRYELFKTELNSANTDFAPSYYLDKLVFSSSRKSTGFSNDIHEWNNQPFLDLYSVDLEDEAKEKPFSNNLNFKYHESTTVFTKDGNTVYFTRNNFTNKNYQESAKGINMLKLYRSIKVNGKWSEAVELPFNSNEFSVAHPALSKDEQTLYFASDMPGGEGLSDLYMVSIYGDSFGTVTSLGDVINTEGRETFPFISVNGDLFFASDGHQGLGGLDVFVTCKDDKGAYGEAYNMGKPLNSSSDDFTFVIDTVSSTGFIASNRKGGLGAADIYKFKQLTPPIKSCVQKVKGVVVDKETNAIIPNATVVILDDNNKVLFETISDEEGLFNFDEVFCSREYILRASKTGFEPNELSFETSDKLFSEDIFKTITLLKKIEVAVGNDLNKVLNLEPIYFDLNKSFIRPDAEIELQKVIAFMKVYPEFTIDVRSHTDSRDSHSYNEKLSAKRNIATLNYMIEKGGIATDRLSGNGFGETQLVNKCSDGVKCTEEEHQLNRRSEFIIGH